MGVKGSLLSILNRIETDYIYISLDVDIGSLNAIHAARFMNVVGIGRAEIYQLAELLGKTIRDAPELIGVDVNGIETFLLGRCFPNGVRDFTLETVTDFIRLLLGHEAKYI